MKLKSALRGLLVTDGSPATRRDAVAFLRKYSDASRTVTHYACRGKQTATVVALLEALGLVKDTDFKVLSSTLDPESNSVRMTGPKAADAVRDIVSAVTAAGRNWLDRAYAAPQTATPDEIVSGLPEDTADAPSAPVEDRDAETRHNLHFTGLHMLGRTDAILATIVHPATIPVGIPNFPQCYAYAKDWAERMIGKPERPYLLPLPVLEVYVRLVDHTDTSPMVFAATAAMSQATRLARTDEKIPTIPFTQAPIPCVLDGEDNPASGYFCNTAEQLRGADVSNKTCVVAVCDAPLVFGEGYDDVLRPVEMAVRRLPLWKYVQDIYRNAYPDLNVGFWSKGMRVAVSPDSRTWITRESDNSAFLGHNFDFRAGFSRGDEVMLAKYVMVVTDRALNRGYSDVSVFMDNYNAPGILEVGGDGSADFTNAALSKDEIGWEWFCMNHCAPMNPWRHSYWNKATDGTTSANFKRYREFKAGVDNEGFRSLSCPDTNPNFNPKRGNTDEFEFTSTSGFVSAIQLALRLHAPHHELPFRDWEGEDRELHGTDSVIAAVYTGISTDLSPSIMDENPDDVFPGLPMHDAGHLPASDGVEPRCYTDWLAKMAKDSSCQVRFAQRSRGTPRTAVTVVETNVDAYEFMSYQSSDVDKIAFRLGTAFMKNILLRYADPYCVTDEKLDHQKFHVCGDYDHHMKNDCGAGLPLLFPGTPIEEIRTVPRVGFAVDSYGRLLIVFTVSGAEFALSRIAYRWTEELPLLTANVLARTTSASVDGVRIPAGSRGDFDNVVAYLQRYYNTIGTGDFSGDAAVIPSEGMIGPMFRAPFSGVAPGEAPIRSWFDSWDKFSPAMAFAS